MNIMTKRGSQDNVVTYEHICDTSDDMVNIDPNYITLGSICIVINGEDGGMEVYMANSNKEWNSIAMGAGSSEGSASSLVDLLDVKVLNPTDGQTLVYSAEEGKWVNNSSSGGSTGGIMVVKSTYDEMIGADTLDHTWQEMYDSIENGVPVLACIEDSGYYAQTAPVFLFINEEDAFVAACNGTEYTCIEPDGYPILEMEGGNEGK